MHFEETAVFLLAVVSCVLAIQHSGDRSEARREGRRTGSNGGRRERLQGSPEGSYDFIVVGAGSTGAIVANRLSADGKHSVLLLEKGGMPSSVADVPALAAEMWNSVNADKYEIEKQEGMFLGLDKQIAVWLRGKGLGGTSLMNYMVYTRAPKTYYDRMAADGNPGWSYDDVLPYFKEMETAHIANFNPNTRGSSGELHVTENPSTSDAGMAFVEACQQSGLQLLPDYNTDNPSGIGFLQGNVCNGRRCHTDRAFLRNIRDRSNLQIEINALVTKLIIGSDGKTVEGIEYLQSGETKTARAGKEVILSAGALASPQIMMLSGIGPRAHLEDLGIKVVNDLPVGETLFDHFMYPGAMFELNADGVTPSLSLVSNPDSWEKFFLERNGPLTVPGLAIEAVGFVKTPVSNETIDYPDTEYVYFGGGFNSDNGQLLRHQWQMTDDTYNTLFKPYEGKPVWSVFLIQFRPESKGFMKLRSTNPTDRPMFYPNYFTDPEGKDMKSMIGAIRILQGIAKSPAMAKYGSEMNLRSLPGCKATVPDSDEFWECMIRHIGNCGFHVTSTSKMGPRSDPKAVVDHELKVHGMTNLRVADIGIFPTPITGHPNGPAMMVGARAADMILKTYRGGNVRRSIKN